MVVTENVGRMHIDNMAHKGISTEGIFILNSRGNFVHLNKKALELLGKVHSEIEGRHFTSILPEKERGKIYGQELLEGKGIKYVISKFVYDRKLSLEVTINPIVRGGKIVMFVGTVRDITPVEDMKEEVRKAFYREKIFRESISHHFFNPLVIARGYIQLVMDSMPESDERKRLEGAKKALGRIEAVVKNVIKNGDIKE